ncbi:methylsterol monooxygenase 1-1 [Sorghum bicolor]|uniref:aldehyde oxygenase (deformylating) n=1 Tax=Sorghum bicolor TaxID=4558 RepID=A0A1Z5R8G5_SORBI|nr:methylsterol monooxygenase 1-1 [Sorghum bicolor]OQU80062.1 hypothetical protein SORBI_3007G073500 [Sorghum bicolor]|eukprot:XP_002444011.2 methylsterol monooxygenase 1-1 [Sorghum bicolor]
MIPYGTAAEAEAALGRGLTPAEAAWFRYSAAMPDHWLLWHNTFILFLAHMVVPLPLALLERVAPAFAMRYKLQPRVRLSMAAVARYFGDTIRVFLLVLVPYQLISYPVVKVGGIRMGLPLPSVGEVAVQLVAYALVEDYLSYWIHRLLHTEWGYHKIHHVHHQVTAPTSFATSYSHWAEVAVFGVPTFAGPTIAPCHVVTHWLWFAVSIFEAISAHCGYNFPFDPTKLIPYHGGAEFHDYHHLVGRQSNSNFSSIFTYCDYIYGTDKGYKYYKANVAKVKAKLARNSTEREGRNGFSSTKLD